MAWGDGGAGRGGNPAWGGAPTYQQYAASKYFGGGGSPFGMANAGNTYGGNTGGGYQPYSMAGQGNQARTTQPTQPYTSPANPSGITAGQPSTAGATTPNPGGAYVGQNYVPSTTETITLSPQQQAILDAQQKFQTGLLGSGNAMLSGLPTGGLDLSGIAAAPTMGQYNTEAANAVYNQQAAYLDPQFKVEQQQMADQLRDQGIPEGSDAFNQQMDAFNRQKTFAYGQARDAAIQEGYNVANQQFQQGMAARQQGVSEAESKYSMPVSNLATLMNAYTGTGGVQVPQGAAAQPNIPAPDYGGAYGTSLGQQNVGYQAGLNRYQNTLGDASNLATTVALYSMFH